LAPFNAPFFLTLNILNATFRAGLVPLRTVGFAVVDIGLTFFPYFENDKAKTLTERLGDLTLNTFKNIGLAMFDLLVSFPVRVVSAVLNAAASPFYLLRAPIRLAMESSRETLEHTDYSLLRPARSLLITELANFEPTFRRGL